ncbi:MAG: YggT family protein [Desulfobacterales bacterium]|nr:YggT family protein [Desulfobacterales bacterium]
MLVLGNFLYALAVVVDYALTIYLWVIIARAVLSWVSPDPYNPIVRFIHNVTEPVLSRVRRALPLNLGGIDVSPIIVMMAVIFVQKFLVGSLVGLSRTMM